MAAGSDATGFWLAFPEHPTGQFEGTDISKATWPRRTKLREFKGNVAHSNFDSFMGDRAPRADGHFAVGGYVSLVNPADANSAQAESVVEDFTSYKNRNSGIWARGELRLYKNLKMADNAIGFTQASGNFGQSAYTSRVVDSLFVGETENIGNPRTPAEKAYGRSLPQPAVADFPIRGYEFYDYHHELDNNTFVNYQDNATRKTGAISYLLFTSFGMSSNNTVAALEIHQRQAGVFPADRQQVEQRRLRQYGLQDLGVQRQGRHHHRCPQFLHRQRHRNRRRQILRGQAHLERRGVQGRCRPHECWRRWWCCWVRRLRRRRRTAWCRWSRCRLPVPVPGAGARRSRCRSPGAAAPGPGAAGPAAGAPDLAANLLSIPLPQVVVESEVPVHLQGRQSFSAAMARSSPPTGKPTYERAPSTR